MSLGANPALIAISVTTSWSKEPPPVHGTLPGVLAHAVMSSFRDVYGESPGTTITSYSSTTTARGFTSA